VRRAVACLLLAACGGGSRAGGPSSPAAGAKPADEKFSPAQIAEKATPSVVLIKTAQQIGTGFAVWNDRVATNLHVLAGAREATVITTDGRELKDIQVLGYDAAHDLAVLKLPVNDLKPLVLGDSAHVKPGERVVAIGHPMGLGNTVSDGIVSAVRVMDPRVTLLQITAPIAPGSSGGPIFNERAEVIGIATLFAAEGQNLNFGVPVAYLKPLLLSEQAIPLTAITGRMDLRLLEGCSFDDIKVSVESIDDAISRGAPMYNKGDHQGCFDTYQATALKIVGKLQACKGVKETLLGAVTTANRMDKPSEKAWAMRHAFDRIRLAVKAAIDEAEGKGVGPQ
jgi:serine protease Do